MKVSTMKISWYAHNLITNKLHNNITSEWRLVFDSQLKQVNQTMEYLQNWLVTAWKHHKNVCSCEIREVLNVDPLLRMMKRHHGLQWFEHVAGMPQQSLARRVMLATLCQRESNPGINQALGSATTSPMWHGSVLLWSLPIVVIVNCLWGISRLPRVAAPATLPKGKVNVERCGNEWAGLTSILEKIHIKVRCK